ncbi:MAG: DUF2062 domain-containing protein [Candidatus Thiodiazotropha sp.]
MPKRLIKSLLPHHDEVRNHKHLRLFGSLMHDPNIWHLNRRSVSGAFAVGLFMAFIPLPMQMVFAAAAAIFFRVNLPLSVALVWITNPITIPPMFYFAYLVGTWITGENATLEPFQLSWDWIQSLGNEVLIPLIIGSLVCATVSSILGYSLILWIWRWHAVEKWKARRLRKKNHGTPSAPST